MSVTGNYSICDYCGACIWGDECSECDSKSRKLIDQINDLKAENERLRNPWVIVGDESKPPDRILGILKSQNISCIYMRERFYQKKENWWKWCRINLSDYMPIPEVSE